MDLGFTESKEYSNLCFKVEGKRPVMLLLYVDDLFLTGKVELIKVTRRIHATEFKMKDLGIVHYFLDMDMWQSANGISLRQGKYAVDILKRFRMIDYKDMATPMELSLKLLSDVSCHAVSSYDLFLDVPDKYETIYLLCCEHIE